MQPERELAAATRPGDGPDDAVQHAVEAFVQAHGSDAAPDPAAFAARYPEAIRPRVLAQCREFLAFDGLLGHQPWQPDAATPAPGRTFGDFVIQEELGRGGMGVVYLAWQPSLRRRVALKVMASGLTLSKRHVERFRREAAAAAQLHHRAIVAVHALVEVDGTFALAMDYVAGRNLADILDDLRLANGDGATTVEGTLGLAPDKGYVAEAAMFVAELASALAVAHQANVVHRDLKPRNLMLDERRQVRLLDFGLAKSLDGGSISMSGEITGTAHYLSPEQTLAKRVEVDHRADIWSLGVILYEVLTLRRPFDGKNLQQIVYEICFQEPVPPQRRNHKVPRDLAIVCQKALEKDPSKRYQTAAELEADLQRFLRWEPVHAKPAGAFTRAAKWARRHRVETTVVALALVSALVAWGFAWQRGQRADDLLASAAAAAGGGRYADAYTSANQALALRNDETTRARLEQYAEAVRRTQLEAASLAVQSRNAVDVDREHAIRLALAAVDKHASLDTRSAVLDALGRGSVTRTLRAPGDDPLPRLLAASWAPDGRHVATIGYGGHAQLWDAATGAVALSLRGHPTAPGSPVLGVGFAGDGRIVTAGTDRTLRFWRREDGSLEHTVALPGVAAGMQLDATGARALVLTYDKDGASAAQVFDTATFAPVSPLVAHPHRLTAWALAADGHLAATCSGSGVRVWRVADGRDVFAQPVATHSALPALAFAPDARLLAVADGNDVLLVDAADGRVAGRVRHSGAVRAVAFDPAGARLLTGAADRTARVWALRRDGAGAVEGREVATFGDHEAPVQHVAFAANGQLALTATAGGQRGELAVHDVDPGREGASSTLYRYATGPSVLAAAFAPDGGAVVAVAGSERAFVWDFRQALGVVTIPQPGWAGAVGFDASGARLATGGTDERVRLWSAADGELLWTSRALQRPQTRLDVAGGRIACASLRDGAVHLLRLDDGEVLGELAGPGDAVHAVRFQADGTRVMAAGSGAAHDGLLLLWDVAPRAVAFRLARPKPIVAADLRADGAIVATVEQDERTVRLWSVHDGALRGELDGHADAVGAVRFAPAGGGVLTASADGQLRVWDDDGAPRLALRVEQAPRHVAFSRDGAWIVACCEGGEARLWRADGTDHLRFRGHRGHLDCGAFRPDGAACATAARDGTVCVWPTDPVGVARRLLGQPSTTASPGNR